MVSIKTKKDSSSCFFWEKTKCLIYEVRPVQCSSYPFWDVLLENKHKWDMEKEFCPGIGIGKVFGKEEIEKIRHSFNEIDFMLKDKELTQ